LVFHVFAALAEFERDWSGNVPSSASPRLARGRRGGRPRVMTAAKLRQARRMHTERRPISEIAAVLGVGRATVYRHLHTSPE
jgi:DNA invertase Pin-like site-specific DNA recombinase